MGATFAAQTFGVTPDILNVAKGLTNGAIPMGAVIGSSVLYDAFMAVEQAERLIELPGYTYSAHPVACAAALAALDILQDDNMVARSALAPVLEDSSRAWGSKHITDIRNFGLAGNCSSHRATVILLSDLLRLVCAAGKGLYVRWVAIHCNLHALYRSARANSEYGHHSRRGHRRDCVTARQPAVVGRQHRKVVFAS